MAWRIQAIALIVIAFAAVTACGGGGSSGGSQTSSAGHTTTGAHASSSSTSTVAAKPLPPPTHTSCRSVVYIGDSTSDGEALASFVPDPRLRAPAQLRKIGVQRIHMEVSGARSIVETFKGIPNGATVAERYVSGGYRGCWIIALGTNEAADVAAGSAVGLKARIARMMSIIGSQPVMWVNAITIAGSPEYYGEDGMRRWDQDLLAACEGHPTMRVFDWARLAKQRWFIPDGVHYTTPGYEARTRIIAHGLVNAFPQGRPPSHSCLVR
ncbi:MAG: SGNH/GDSL hydrolase family protein [Solirubrobacteraceae bacterium]